MVLRVPLSWTVSMTFEFGDNNHIAVWENHDKFAGLQESRRIAWSYHYGPVTARDSKGRAIQGAASDPLTIRIDTCSGLHLHYASQEPHYPQSRITGLDLQSVDAIGFVKAVLKHRKSGKDFKKILGFKLS